MKERPILFSGAMVRAILAGRKTQTRRVVKPQPLYLYEPRNVCVRYEPSMQDKNGSLYPGDPVFGIYNDEEGWVCPYGEPGDRLWVRETWSDDALCMYPCPPVWYRASDSIDRNEGHTCPKESRGRYADCLACWEEREGRKFKWKPSIFMRRHHCRIVLEIVAVRVERLQEITGHDAIAEGIQPYVTQTATCTITSYHDYLTGKHDQAARNSYETLWRSINGPDSWDVNPWVWVVEFKPL